jgi:hypothetical protein
MYNDFRPRNEPEQGGAFTRRERPSQRAGLSGRPAPSGQTFGLAINLKAARTLDLKMPSSVLPRAVEVIQ